MRTAGEAGHEWGRGRGRALQCCCEPKIALKVKSIKQGSEKEKERE